MKCQLKKMQVLTDFSETAVHTVERVAAVAYMYVVRLPFSRHAVSGKQLALNVLRCADSINTGPIVISIAHESKLTKIFIGPLAKQIVNHSRIPVMSIKPHYGKFESINLTGAYSIY